jgi:FtsP/CotA-like multicopper oxidase with cupredoxin domain
MNVEPRKYRLRFLNAAVSRDWDLYFRTTTSTARIPFQVIGSDAGLLEKPATTSDLYIAPAERYEVVIDFSNYAGQSIDLRSVPQSNDVGKADEYERTTEVMRFVVSSTPVQDPSQVPSTLRQVPFPPATAGATKRHFRFERTNSQWLINDVGFADVEHRVLAKPPVGTVEIWELENSSGGWTHPIHVHLVDFRVVKRTGSRESVRDAVLPYESGGLKDVVWLGRGETVTIEAHYLPWT